MARRSKLEKGSASEIDAEDFGPEKAESLPDTSAKDADKDSTLKAEDDEDEDEDKKIDKSDDDDDDDDDDDCDKAKKSEGVEAKLQRAVRHLVTLVKSTDPAMRKEALFAKSMNGARLSDQEADELDALVRGRSLEEPLRQRAAPALTKSFKKAVQESGALEDLVKGIAGSHGTLCDEIDTLRQSMDEVHCLLAKAIGAMGETLGSIHSGQGSIAEALDKSLGQPAHAPRSQGVSGFSERAFNGSASGTSPEKAEGALRQMLKSAPSTAARDTIAGALFQLQSTRHVSAPVQQMIKSHLASA